MIIINEYFLLCNVHNYHVAMIIDTGMPLAKFVKDLNCNIVYVNGRRRVLAQP